MSCIEGQVWDIPCPVCGKSDQVYKGHAAVLFCAHCTVSWGETEDVSQVKLGLQEKGKATDIASLVVTLLPDAVGVIQEMLESERRLQQVEGGKAPRDFGTVIVDMSNVQRLVHLAMRLTDDDAKRMTKKLTDVRRAAYEVLLQARMDELGCPGKAELKDSGELRKLSEISKTDAGHITNTYNYDLAQGIRRIGEGAPKANRHVYAKRLRAWESKRAAWKYEQIALYTLLSTDTAAFHAFTKKNKLTGRARFAPDTAAEPICAGWINRGWVTLKVAEANPTPQHIGCVHGWEVEYDALVECDNLWAG